MEGLLPKDTGRSRQKTRTTTHFFPLDAGEARGRLTVMAASGCPRLIALRVHIVKEPLITWPGDQRYSTDW